VQTRGGKLRDGEVERAARKTASQGDGGSGVNEADYSGWRSGIVEKDAERELKEQEWMGRVS
jgi:hypothetical protein